MMLFAGLLATACDSGDIYPVDPETVAGIPVEAAFRFTHTEAWPESYEILLGIFDDESDIPIVSKNISQPAEGAKVSVSLSGIPEGAKSVRLCLAKSGRKTFYTLYEKKLDDVPSNAVVISEQTINLLQYGRIQEQVFSQCIQCHGGANWAGAGLYLTPGRSYDALVDMPSEKSPKKRVFPENVSGSFLIDVLTGEPSGFSYQHSTSISILKSDDITLLKEWIKSGAPD
jgi:hypothetical protein